MLNLTRRIVLLLAIALATVGSIWAQSDRGTIAGVVTDQSGAVIAGAAVRATNTGTNASYTATTGASGSFAFPDLRVGTYEVTAEFKGFKRFVQSGIVLEVGQTAALDIRMQLGAVTETVQVTAQPLLDKDTSDRGTVVTSRDVEELPIVSQAEQRNPGFYMTLAPGVTGRGTATPTASGSGRQLDTTVNGSPSGAVEFHLDGLLIGQGYMLSGQFSELPFPPDAVGEFRVMTLNPPAEFGQTGAGITAFSIKSGSNQLHGQAYENLRNTSLDSRGFFAPKTPIEKQNEFGITAGGPVYIPHIYNGKNKTFFFGWYDGFRLRQNPSNALDTVPTAAMRGGNLSNMLNPLSPVADCGTPVAPATAGTAACLDALGRPIYSNEVYDPATTRTVGPGAADPETGLINTSGAAAILRDGFGFSPTTGQPGTGANVIPSARFDPLAVKIFSYFPNPTLPGNRYGYVDNWLSSYLASTTINNWGSKIDHSITNNNRIMGEMIWQKNFTPSGSKWPGAISEGGISYTQQDIARLSDDWIITPRIANHFVAGFNRVGESSIPTAGTGWPATLGYSGVPQMGFGSTFPEMDINGLGNTYARGGNSTSADNVFNVSDSITVSHGRHTIKTGIDYIKFQTNAFSSTYQSSYLRFEAGTTALPGPSAWYNDGCTPGGPCTGTGTAGLLLGLVSYGQAGINTAPVGDREGRYSGYVQDDFRFSRKLTVNAGLRYDLMLPTVGVHNVFSWMDPTVTNPAIGIKGAQVFGTASERAPAKADTKGFAPRLGLAYALNDKTVIRTGYGIIYAAGGAYRSQGNSFSQQGFSASDSVTEDASTGYTGLLPGTVTGNASYHFQLQNGWPSSLFTPPPFINPSATLGEGPPSFGAYPNDGNMPYLQQYFFSVQREVPGKILLDVSYVGTKGTHLPSRLMNSNATPAQYMDTFLYTGAKGAAGNYIFSPISTAAVQGLPVVQSMPVDPATGNHSPFKGFEALWGGNATLGQALRPFPQFQTDTVEGLSQLRDFDEVVGNSDYNALQIQARKHFSEGLTFLASYTWSKTITDAGSIYNEFSGFTQDFYNARAEKSLSINDYPQSVVLSYEYQLPFGPGKKFANTGGFAGKVIGGWEIAGVQEYQSGPPQIIASGSNPMNPYEGANSFLTRPNIVPGVPKKSQALREGKWDPNGTVVNGVDYGAVNNVAAWVNPSTNAANPWTFGTAPPTDGGVRRFPFLNEDISIIKRTKINERVNIEFRGDFLNIFNRTLFGFDQGGDQYGSILQGNQVASGLGGFGHISAQSNFPREIQFGLKINY